ncbi:conjugal transfer protein TrbL [Euzebya tangerina]|uniref:conjugal transfer protein TrbL n=1 Tax=Euzebya tangerina TaxID=591198 RepID=UPI000E30B780|nr:conjugal transfer protein TrbL [Euzebya tangerina]
MGICDVPAIAAVCASAGEGAATLVAAPFAWLAEAMGGAAAWMIESLWQLFDTTTSVDLTSPAYIGVYNLVFGLAVWLMAILFLLQLIGGLLRRDPRALSGALLGIAKGLLGSFLAVGMVGLGLEITDQLVVVIVQAAGTSMTQLGEELAVAAVALGGVTVNAAGAGAIVTIFLAGLMITAAALVWSSLFIRKALLLVAVVLAPIALAGYSWDATRGWFAKWASFVLALIVAKVVMVIIFLVATAQIASPIEADLASVSDAVAGIVLLLVAAFAPYMAYKFLSFAGIDSYQLTSAEQDTKGALARSIPRPNMPRRDPARVINPTGSPTGQTPGPVGGAAGQPGAAGPTGAAGASGAGAGQAGAAGGAAGAAGGVGVAAGVVSAAASAGPKLGKAVAAQTSQQTQAAIHQPPVSQPDRAAGRPAPPNPHPGPAGPPSDAT